MKIGRRGVAVLFLMVTFGAGLAVPPAHADNRLPLLAAGEVGPQSLLVDLAAWQHR
jgi:hypothetical protein